MRSSIEGIFLESAELHKIQHKSIQVVAEGTGLENYLNKKCSGSSQLSMQCLSKKN